MSYCILEGDVLLQLRDLPDESVHCVVTSPPYWGLRDYKTDGQIGLEKTPQEYLEKMVTIFREVKRVLRKDGTAWVNMGDSYWASGRGGGGSYEKERRGWQQIPSKRLPRGTGRWGSGNVKVAGLKRKDLIGMPWRLAFALQEDGWWLRQDIIWSKPNPMPLSVTDRCTTAHEYIFLLTKSARYYYNAAAIRTRLADKTFSTFGSKRRRLTEDPLIAAGNISRDVPERKPKQWKMPDGWDTGSGAHGSFHRNGREKGKKSDKQRGHSRRHAGFNERWDLMSVAEQRSMGANRRSVWEIATKGYKEAHFATFPEEIPRLCIMAGCPEGGTVLDPFSGSGTTGMVALRLNRKYIGIEINPDYVEMSHRRIQMDAPLLNKCSLADEVSA